MQSPKHMMTYISWEQKKKIDFQAHKNEGKEK